MDTQDTAKVHQAVARHGGGFRLSRSEKTGDGIARVTREQLGHIEGLLPECGSDAEALHEIRVTTKRLRAIAKLLKPYDGVLADHIRNTTSHIAGSLSTQRDRDVMRETLDKLMKHVEPDTLPGESSLNMLLPALKESTTEQAVMLSEQTRQLHRYLDTAWQDRLDARDLLQRFDRQQHRLLKRWQAMDTTSTVESWHKLRKQVKAHLYQCQLLRKHHPSIDKKTIASLKKLGERLGKLHDLDVIVSRIDAMPPGDAGEELGSLLDVIESHRQRQIRKILKTGKSLFGRN